MAKTTFSAGTPVSAAFLNSINNPVFADPADNDGEIPLINNDDLATGSGTVKGDFYGFFDQLKATAGTGLSVNYTSGAVLINGAIATVSAAAISVPDDSTVILYVTTAGTVAQAISALVPVAAYRFAQVVSISGEIDTITDLRSRFALLPKSGAIRVFGGGGDEGDKVVSGAETFDLGEYYFKNFTVEAAGVLTISSGARIYVSGICTIAGTITVTAAAGGGGRAGGTGTAGNFGGFSGTGFGAGRGPQGGEPYNYVLSGVGSGGASGFVLPSSGNSADCASGGSGGGGITIDCAGPLSVISGASILAKGSNGGSPGAIVGTPNASGGGGGSGGLILLKSLISVTVAGTLDVRGGNGGAANTGNAYGGGAGGGGRVVILSPSINTTGSTILLAAGTNGANIGTPGTGSGGGGGYGGRGATSGSAPTPAAVGILTTRNVIPVG